MIEKLKENNVAFGLMTNEERETLEKVGKDNCIIYLEDGWIKAFKYDGFEKTCVYRINPDYNTAKTVSYKVYPNDDGIYTFIKDTFMYSLHEAQSIVCFIGIEYKERKGQLFASGGLITKDGHRHYSSFVKDVAPMTPVRVWFME